MVNGTITAHYDGQVANDDVGNALDVQRDTLETGAGVQTQDRGIAGDPHLCCALDRAINVDDGSLIGSRCLGEL